VAAARATNPIIQAVLSVAKKTPRRKPANPEETVMSQKKVVGTSAVRIDGLDKGTGAARYVDDLDFGPGLLHAAMATSPHAHARIRKIDTSAAERAPGVVRVVTGKDCPHKFGLYMQDRDIFPQDRVRFVGEQVAAVIAETPEAALRAVRLIRVDYEPLPAVLSLGEALRRMPS
jgi:CO/xanthine dehydrogenase Mo-binding subunit